MNEKKLDLFEVSVELRDLAASCSFISWALGPDGCDGRMSMMDVHEALDGVSRHLLRVADDLDN